QALDGYIMFKRAELHAQLYEAVRGIVDLRFNAQVDAVRPLRDAVEVDSSGRTERYDVVIGSDGVHSRTRELVFGGGFMRPMGGSYLAMNIEGPHQLDEGTLEMFFGQGQHAALFPGSAHERTVMIYYGDGGLPLPESRDASSMKRFLLQAYAGYPPAL